MVMEITLYETWIYKMKLSSIRKIPRLWRYRVLEEVENLHGFRGREGTTESKYMNAYGEVNFVGKLPLHAIKLVYKLSNLCINWEG